MELAVIVTVARRCISDSLRRYYCRRTPHSSSSRLWRREFSLGTITAVTTNHCSVSGLLGLGRSFHSVLHSPQELSYLWLVPGAASALPLHWEDPQEPEDCPLVPELVPNRHKQKWLDLPFKSVEAQMYLCSRLPGSFHIAHVVSHCCCFICNIAVPLSPLCCCHGTYFFRTAAFVYTLIGCWVPQKSFW